MQQILEISQKTENIKEIPEVFIEKSNSYTKINDDANIIKNSSKKDYYYMKNVKLTQLDNRLKMIIRKTESLNIVALDYWEKFVEVCKDSSNCGISHFLENMAFKGTKT